MVQAGNLTKALLWRLTWQPSESMQLPSGNEVLSSLLVNPRIPLQAWQEAGSHLVHPLQGDGWLRLHMHIPHIKSKLC